ncbi:RHS repeat protein [Agrobacterium rosae]|uniref:RHS repeat protein n=1 Tax=Agrobacterium rosae TaxID=1972867 RepID=UPI0011AF6B2D|nr:RHS repeat protein [Agrobacterium rosae]
MEWVEGSDGLSLDFVNDGVGQRLGITLIGTDGTRLELARYAYDSAGRMVSSDCAFGMSVRYMWQERQNLLTSWRNITGASTTRFTYDTLGRVIHTATNGIWNHDRFHYDVGETVYMPGGMEAAAQRFRYDENDKIVEEIDALGGCVAHSYDRAGFRVATRDQNGHENRTRYDIHGNVKEQVDGEGRSTNYVWGDDGELLMVLDGAGNHKTYAPDANANVIAETDSEGNVTRLTRDQNGRVTATEFADGTVEHRNWDSFNRLIIRRHATRHRAPVWTESLQCRCRGLHEPHRRSWLPAPAKDHNRHSTSAVGRQNIQSMQTLDG